MPSATTLSKSKTVITPESIKERFPAPKSYETLDCRPGSFGHYLQHFPLKPEGTEVMLYDGRKKNRQDVHLAVLDISIGKKDLQQCADATIRLRSEWMYSTGKRNEISFNFTNGFPASFKKWSAGNSLLIEGNKVSWYPDAKNDKSVQSFNRYLECVFMYAGTLSLSKELKYKHLNEMKVGDLLLHGGTPGHAAIVVNIAKNSSGELAFMLAQSYMPAQNIHLLKNPKTGKAWYFLKEVKKVIQTPEFVFNKGQLAEWNK